MKTATFILLPAFALSALAAPLENAESKETPKFDMHKGMTREQEGHKLVPGGMAPEIQELKPLFGDYAPGSKRKKIRYGKYALPKVSATTLSSLLTGEQGTINTVTANMKKPCDQCNLITMQAGLEYANGSLAEPTNGGWLHHIVMVMSGANRKDVLCNIPVERFFSSGNEKTPTAFGDVIEKKVKSAFPVYPSDTLSAELELMNMIDIPLDVWITIDYEYLEGPLAKDWKMAKALWLDVTNCGISSVKTKSTPKFTYESKPYTSAFEGEMLGVGGHLHDGGVNVNVYQQPANGPKKVICDSKAEYEGGTDASHMSPMPASAPASAPVPKPAEGAKPNDMAGMAGMAGMNGMRTKRDGPHNANDGMAHIKEMSTCSSLGPIKKGDKIWIDANYDFGKFAGMKKNNGGYSDVMGIAILYMAVNTS